MRAPLCAVSERFGLILPLLGKNASSTLRGEVRRLDPSSRELAWSGIDHELRERATVACFLREPVARLLSAYQEVSLRHEMGLLEAPIECLDLPDDLGRLEAFVDYLEEHGAWDPHLRSQASATAGLAVDRWGRVETLQADMEELYRELGLPACPQLPTRRSRAERAREYHYSRYRLAPQDLPGPTRERIRRIYQEDLDLLDGVSVRSAEGPGVSVWLSRSSAPSLHFPDLGPVGGQDLLRAFVSENQRRERCVLLRLGGRGFYAELTTMARAMAYAWNSDRQLLLDSTGFRYRSELGWNDYFLPLCAGPESVDPERIDETLHFETDRAGFRRLLSHMPSELELGGNALRSWRAILRQLSALIFRPNEACAAEIRDLVAALGLPALYDAIHVRRGDKVGDEDAFYPVDLYLSQLDRLEEVDALFVMTDDHAAVDETRLALERRGATIPVLTLCPQEARGFDVGALRAGRPFMEGAGRADGRSADRSYKWSQVVTLLAETVVAARARRFVSTRRSNVGFEVSALRRFPADTVLLDLRSLESARGGAGRPSSVAAPISRAGPTATASAVTVELELSDGRRDRVDLPAGSDLLEQLRASRRRAAGDLPPLLEIPLFGGTAALAFAPRSLLHLDVLGPDALTTKPPAARGAVETAAWIDRAQRPGSDRGGTLRSSCEPLAVNPVELDRRRGDTYFLFLDLFVHPSRQKLVAVAPHYGDDWALEDVGVDVHGIDLELADGHRVRGRHIPHRLDSYEPTVLWDFEDPVLAARLTEGDEIALRVVAGPHRRELTLSTLPEPAYEVALSVIVKNENRWLRTFLEYYLTCLGAEHVLLYDNGCDQPDELARILRPYREEGRLTYIPWPYRWRNRRRRAMIGQPTQQAHSLNRFANSRWIGFFDVDELLRLPGETLPTFLERYRDAPVDGLSFGMRWFEYDGPLGLDEVEDPPLTFLQRRRDAYGRKAQKLIVAPATVRFLRLHWLEEGKRELQIDDAEIFFHHYALRPGRFQGEGTATGERVRDDYMLRFEDTLAGTAAVRAARPADEKAWTRHLRACQAAAEAESSRLSGEVLATPGMCGVYNRHFLNRLCDFAGCRYLEIGSYLGASVSAATFRNDVDAVCIDDWSQFQGSRREMERHLARYRGRDRVEVIEADCFTLDVANLGPFDVFYYDGDHRRESHRRAVERYAGCLADLGVIVVDDWNRPWVREGTREGLARLQGSKVVFEHEILLPASDLVGMPRHPGRLTWWNGLAVFLLRREATG